MKRAAFIIILTVALVSFSCYLIGRTGEPLAFLKRAKPAHSWSWRDGSTVDVYFVSGSHSKFIAAVRNELNGEDAASMADEFGSIWILPQCMVKVQKGRWEMIGVSSQDHVASQVATTQGTTVIVKKWDDDRGLWSRFVGIFQL